MKYIQILSFSFGKIFSMICLFSKINIPLLSLQINSSLALNRLRFHFSNQLFSSPPNNIFVLLYGNTSQAVDEHLIELYLFRFNIQWSRH